MPFEELMIWNCEAIIENHKQREAIDEAKQRRK